MGDSDRFTWDSAKYPKYGRHFNYEEIPETSTAVVAKVPTSKSGEYVVYVNSHLQDHKTFLYELSDELTIYGFQPICGMETLALGLPFKNVSKAIKGACVHVAIFTESYAKSPYCLEELCEMLKSEQQIIPVFYDVKRSDLQRIEDGPYEEAFMKHKKYGRDKKIPTWKEALCKVVDYKGFIMDEVDG